MRALSIRQPFAELILRGIKTVEYRSRPTRIIGERFHIYASRSPAAKFWSTDLAMPEQLPPWMLELAEQVGMIEPDALLPTGVIVGTAVIERVIPPEREDGAAGLYRWELGEVRRVEEPIKPRGHPQPGWFWPFGQ